MRHLPFACLLGSSVLLALACGGLGAPCDRRGSESECGPGEVCAKVDGDLYCRPTCDRDRDCARDEECKKVKDSNEEACKPDDSRDDDDGSPL
jgi:hypothetical protein